MSRTRKGTSSQVAHPRESDLAPPDAPDATSTEGLAPRGSRVSCQKRVTASSGRPSALRRIAPFGDAPAAFLGRGDCQPLARRWLLLPTPGLASSALTRQLQTSPSASRLHPGASDAPNSARATLSTGPSPPGRPTWAGAGLSASGPKSLSSPPLCHAQLSLDTDTCPKGDAALSPPTPPPHAHPRL